MNLKNRIFLQFVFFAIITQNAFSQSLNNNQKNTIRNDIAYYIHSDADIYNYEMGEQNFVVNSVDTFYNPNGFHLLYKLQNGKAYRLDRSYFHGHNFGRFMYMNKGNVYLMGGYGLFTTNNIIETFDFKTREWKVVASSGLRPDFIKGVIFKRDSLVYLFNSSKSGNNVEQDILEKYYYIFNINTNKWSRFLNSYDDFSMINFVVSYNLKKYVISFSTEKTLIINKSDMKYIILPNGSIPIHLQNTNISKVTDNTICYNFLGSTTENLVNVNLNVDSLYKSNNDLAKDLVKNSTNTFTIKIILFVVLAFLFVIFIVKYILSKKAKKNKEKPFVNIINQLKSSSSNRINVDELDKVFQIEHMEAESKKSKRHRIITSLEQEYPGLITRVKDETDKRKFVYHIDKDLVK